MGFLDEIKSIASTIQKIDNVDLYRRIIDLQAEAVTLVGDNLALKQELNELRESVKVRESLRFDHNCYWRGIGKESDGPFCSHCWDSRTVLMRMWTMADPKFSECPSCKRGMRVPRKENNFATSERAR